MAAIAKTWGTGAFTEVEDNLVPNFSTGFRVIADTPTSAKFISVLSPINYRTTFKWVLSKIGNVYKTLAGDTVPVTEQSSNVTGQTLFGELTTILTKPNATSTGVIQLPIQARVELRVPTDADLTDSVIMEIVTALLGFYFDSAGDTRITSELLRGVLVPPGA